ncbi:MAG TPA: hypothetical protein VHV27_00150 [Phenylobacterium sp.]|jgi:hypothetical protein|nr:hypothetical protein [Phenylobacterium sp.]
MGEPSDAADAVTAPLPSEPKLRASWLVRAAPGPDLPDARDRKGAQTGMAIALVGGGLFWAAAISVAVVLLRR